MSTRRAAKKAVDYSQFCDELEDYSGDDDDFQDSPNPPPSKKTRSSKASPKKNGKKGKTTNSGPGKNDKDIMESRRETKLSRLSVQEKVFNRELQAALELSSQGQANGAVNTEGAETFNKEVEIKSPNNGVLQHVEDQVISDDDSGKSCSDYQEDANESESDDSFSSEGSDDDVPKQKKKTMQKTGGKKQRSVKSKNGAQGKNPMKPSRVAPQVSKKLPVISCAKTSSSRTGLQKSTPSKANAASNPMPFVPNLNTAVGSSRTVSPGLSRSNLSPGLGGVHVRQGNPGGIRLGLSRNIRVSKSLHPNAAHST